MKKIIALAVASAFVAPVMAAEITVGGDVEYAFKETNGANTASVSDVDINVSATEELANGMTIEAYVIGDDSSAADLVSELAISGEFGKFSIGDDTDSAAAAYDDMADVAESGLGNGIDQANTTTLQARFEPNLGVAGLTVGISYGAGAASNEVVAYGFKYTTSGLTFAAGQTDEEGQTEATSHVSASYAMGPFYVAVESYDNQGGTADSELSKIAATYNYGPGKVYFEQENAQASSTADELTGRVIGVSYKVGGAVNTYIQTTNQEDSATVETDTTTVGIEYSF